MGIHEDEDRTYTAKDVRAAAGLSYRQLNDWEAKGALPQKTGSGRQWRRFTAREVFALRVCSAIRERFAVPVEKLKFVHTFMLDESANHFRAAIEMISVLGADLWIVTDLEETFVMEADFEFQALIEHGFFSSDEARAFIWLKVNPLVNEMLEVLDCPPLPRHGRAAQMLREAVHSTGPRNTAELEVLNLIRAGDFQKIEIAAQDGKIHTVSATRNMTDTKTLDVEELLRAHEYQTITVTKKNGRVVSATQKVPRKVATTPPKGPQQ